MAIKEIVTKTKLDALANSIALKSGVSAPFTIDEMKTVVDNMSIGGDFITQSKIISPQLTDQTITPDQGYDGLSDVTVKAMPSGSAGVPVALKGSVSNHTVDITPTVTNTTGYISGGTKTGTPVTVSASELVSGTKNINSNNTYDVSNYASVNVNVPTSVNLQQKTVTPTESVQTIIADDNYDGLSSVEVGAISSTYVGSEVTRRTSTDLTRSTYTINVPAGYYEESASKAVERVTHATPQVSINSSTGVIKAVHTQNQGWVEGSGTGADSTSKTLQLTTQAAKTVTPTEESQQAVASGVYTTGAVTVAAIPSDYVGSGITERDSDDLTVSGATVTAPAGYYNIAASKTIDNANLVFNSTSNSTPTIGNTGGKLTLIADVDVRTDGTSTGGYVAGGQQSLGTAKVYLYSNASYNDSDSVSVSNDTITIPAGYYNLNVTKSVASGTAGTPTATKGTVSNHSISVTPSVTNTTGYITGGTKSGTAVSISASELVSGTYSVTSSGTKDVTNYASASVPAGSATTPTTTITANPTISVNSSGLITATASASQNITPNVTEGYVASGTAGVVTVSGSKTQQLTTQAAATYYPSSTDQTILSGSYLTGNQLIKAVTTSNLLAENIKKGITVEIGDSTDSDSVSSVTGTYEEGKFTATITHESTYTYPNIKYDGKFYYNDGATFTYNGGESVQIFLQGIRGGGNLYIDGVQVQSAGLDATTYNWTLPYRDININIETNTEGTVRITSPTINITQNGVHEVGQYGLANVNISAENTDFIVTLTKNSSTDKWEPDCTYAELKAAYDAGKTLVAIAQHTVEGSDDLSLVPCTIEYLTSQNCFAYTVDEKFNDFVSNTGINELTYFFTNTGINLAGKFIHYEVGSPTATAADVVNGKTFINASGHQTGTLVVQHYYTGSTAPTSSLGANGDIYLQS